MVDPQTVNILLGIAAIVLTLVGGGVGIWKLWWRPRLYCEIEDQALVPIGDKNRRRRAEHVLREQGMPTRLMTVKWWNAGRREATNIEVDVETYGQIVDLDTEPRPNDVGGAWEQESHSNSHVRITQDSLKPGTRSKLSIGYHEGEGDASAEARCYGEGREIQPFLSSFRVILLRFVPSILLIGCFLAFTIIYFPELLRHGTMPLGDYIAWGVGTLAIMIGGLGFVFWWSKYIDRRERLVDRH